MYVKREFILAAAAIGFLLGGEGCSSVIAAGGYFGVDPSRLRQELPVGSTREEVEAKLGKPVASRALRDGGRVDTYEYRVRDPQGLAKAIIFAELNVLFSWSLGAAEFFFLPYAIATVMKSRGQEILTYGPDDRFWERGAPPPYGPSDDAVEPPSVGAIRKGCWSQEQGGRPDHPAGGGGGGVRPAEYMYVECISRLLAIWGIE